MTQLLSRKRAILAKIETTYGVDPIPTGAANAILMSNITVSPMEMNLQQRNNIKAYLGNNPSVLAAIYAKLSFDVEIAGSGAAGTVPGYGPLLRACGLSETILATAVTGTAAAGGANSIQFAGTASAVDGAYVGMTVYITGGTGAGQSGVVQSYVGATKTATLTANWTTPTDATSVYNIPKQVVYQPVSSNFESITIYCNVDSVRHILLGARGTVSIKASAQGIPMYSFTMTGMYTTPSDVTMPAVTLSAFQQPLAINNINTSGLVVAGYAAAVGSEFSFDLANSVVFRSLVGGTENVVLTDRKPAGSITQEATSVAAKDWWSQIKAVTLGAFSMTHGTAAGNKVKIDAPAMQLTTPAYSDKDGITMLGTKVDLIPVVGNDEITICLQ